MSSRPSPALRLWLTRLLTLLGVLGLCAAVYFFWQARETRRRIDALDQEERQIKAQMGQERAKLREAAKHGGPLADGLLGLLGYPVQNDDWAENRRKRQALSEQPATYDDLGWEMMGLGIGLTGCGVLGWWWVRWSRRVASAGGTLPGATGLAWIAFATSLLVVGGVLFHLYRNEGLGGIREVFWFILGALVPVIWMKVVAGRLSLARRAEVLAFFFLLGIDVATVGVLYARSGTTGNWPVFGKTTLGENWYLGILLFLWLTGLVTLFTAVSSFRRAGSRRESKSA